MQLQSIKGAESIYLSASFLSKADFCETSSDLDAVIPPFWPPPAKARRGTSNYCLANLCNDNNYVPNNHNDSHIYRPLAVLGRESDCTTDCGAEPIFCWYHPNHQILIFALFVINIVDNAHWNRISEIKASLNLIMTHHQHIFRCCHPAQKGKWTASLMLCSGLPVLILAKQRPTRRVE